MDIHWTRLYLSLYICTWWILDNAPENCHEMLTRNWTWNWNINMKLNNWNWQTCTMHCCLCGTIQLFIQMKTCFDRFSSKIWLKSQCASKQESWGVRWIMQRSYDPWVIRVCHKNELIRDYSYGICLSKPEVKWIQPRLVTWILEEIEFSFKTSNHQHG